MILEDAQLVNYLASYEAVTRRFYLIYEYKGKPQSLLKFQGAWQIRGGDRLSVFGLLGPGGAAA